MNFGEIISLVNVAFALYYIYEVISRKGKCQKIDHDSTKVQLFMFTVLLGMFVVLVAIRFANPVHEITTQEITFWKVFDFVLVLQANIYLRKIKNEYDG